MAIAKNPAKPTLADGAARCQRRKLWADGSVIGATGASWDIAQICDRRATQIRSDGRTFCSRCAKVERRGLFGDRMTWAALA